MKYSFDISNFLEKISAAAAAAAAKSFQLCPTLCDPRAPELSQEFPGGSNGKASA